MASSGENGRLAVRELGQVALATVQELTGYQPEAVTGLTWDGESWRVLVDVLEMARIPSTTDVIGCYELQLDDHGTLHGYRRIKRYKRCETGDDG